MICQECKDTKHNECKGGTHCPCQHRKTKRLSDGTVAVIGRSFEQTTPR